MQSLFDSYPIIAELYCDFINSDEYNHHEITSFFDGNSTEIHKQAVSLAQAGNETGATDKMMSACTEYEFAGFVFGFQRALAMLKETGAVQI